jgi:hypothetical protein
MNIKIMKWHSSVWLMLRKGNPANPAILMLFERSPSVMRANFPFSRWEMVVFGHYSPVFGLGPGEFGLVGSVVGPSTSMQHSFYSI